tara:strand:- start:530 stop:991 length:462 start_codon:yes stop_codon:yes gene_type:complete
MLTPDAPGKYIGKQVIINSDRLLFNAKEDSILLFSNKAISFSTNGSIHFDTSNEDENNFIVNCPNIYLGLDYKDELPNEPAVLGDKLEKFLNEMLDLINSLWDATLYEVSYTESGTFTGPSSLNKGVESRIEGQINELRKQIELFKSNNVKLS